MQRYWDAKAREDAFFFVDDRLEYGNPDVDRFWREGQEALDHVLGVVGAQVRPEDTVIDLGCGLGRLTRVLADRGQRVIAIDISLEMLKRAQELNWHLENVEWRHGDGVSLSPVGDASVDAIVSFVVFQHIPDPAITLGYVREMGRVLRPGGWAAFQISNDPGIHRPRARAERLRRGLRAVVGRAPKGQNAPAWRGSAVGLDELRATADAAGLDIAHLDGAGTQFCLVRLVRRAGS